MVKKIVFLDRDGVINKLVERDGRLVSPRCFDDFELIEGVSEAIGKLKTCGFEIVVVTNQPDISRGLMELAELEMMHSQIRLLGVNAISYCPHSDEDNCECRKPKAGLLLNYLQKSHYCEMDLWMVGDQPSDWKAGETVGAKVVRIGNFGEQNSKNEEWQFVNLEKAVAGIIAQYR